MISLFNQQAIVHLFLALLTSSSLVIRDGEESHFGHFRHLFDGLPAVRLKTSRGSTAAIQGKHLSSLIGHYLASGSFHGNVSGSDCFVQVSGQPVHSGRFGRISPKVCASCFSVSFIFGYLFICFLYSIFCFYAFMIIFHSC